MTACRNKARGAVVAALAGALTLGAAPVMALAVDGAGLMATDDAHSIVDGTVVKFAGDHKDGDTFVADGEPQGLKPELIQPYGTYTEDSQLEVSSFVVYKLADSKTGTSSAGTGRTIDGEDFYYLKDAFGKGKDTSTSLPTEVGTYAVFAKAKDSTGAEHSVKEGATFTIAAASLKGAELYQVNTDGDNDDTSDTVFTFNADEWALTGVATDDFDGLDGKNRLALKSGNAQIDMTGLDYDYYKKDGTHLGTQEDGGYNKIVAAGDYYVIVSGKSGSAYENQKERFDFTIAPYDLSEATIVAADKAWEPNGGDTTTSIESFDGQTFSGSWLEQYVTIDYPSVATSKGEASLTVNVNEAALKAAGYEGSVVESKVVNYDVVDYILATSEVKASYGTDAFGTPDANVNTDYSQADPDVFDASKVSVSYVDPANSKTVETDAFELVVKNVETHEVGGTEMLSQSGTYEVKAVLDSSALDYHVAGESVAMTVTVTNGTIGSNDVAFAYKDEIQSADFSTDEYVPGYDALDDIKVTVKTANGTVDPSKYDVVVTNEDGDEVDTMESAGVYTIEVKADGFAISGNTIKVTVPQRDLANTKLQVRAKNTFNFDRYVDDDDDPLTPDKVEHARVLQYTGEELTASYEWSVDGETWYDLPAADVEVSYSQKGSPVELKEVGNYKVDIKALSDSVNYKNADVVYVEVSDAVVFADVPQGEYYTQAVYDANKQGYVFGMGGTNLFMPNKSMSRAEMTVMLYRMAGGVTDNDWEASETETAYLDRYSDVDATEFYAKALAWATQAGVVRGYEDGTFGPNDDVTVEQYVTMLARYAEVKGDYEAVDTDEVLAGVADGSQVSGFGQDAVAWAVESGYLAQGGADIQPQSPVTRGRAVTVAVRYQPTKASIIGNRG